MLPIGQPHPAAVQLVATIATHFATHGSLDRPMIWHVAFFAARFWRLQVVPLLFGWLIFHMYDFHMLAPDKHNHLTLALFEMGCVDFTDIPDTMHYPEALQW